MGLDPTDPDFECGIVCERCAALFAPDCTPKYVWANVSGMVACPLYFEAVPNGTYKLTQDPDFPCSWGVFVGIMHIQWNAGGNTNFHMQNEFAPFFVFFRNMNAGNCNPEFDNTLECDDPIMPACTGGHCIITWGPEDPCEV